MNRVKEWRALRRDMRRAEPAARAAIASKLADLEREMRPKELAQVREEEASRG